MSCVNQLSCAVLERERECYQLYAHPLLCFLAFYRLLFYRYATFYESTMLSLYHQLYLKNQVCNTMNMLTELPVKFLSSIPLPLPTLPPPLSPPSLFLIYRRLKVNSNKLTSCLQSHERRILFKLLSTLTLLY